MQSGSRLVPKICNSPPFEDAVAFFYFHFLGSGSQTEQNKHIVFLEEDEKCHGRKSQSTTIFIKYLKGIHLFFTSSELSFVSMILIRGISWQRRENTSAWWLAYCSQKEKETRSNKKKPLKYADLVGFFGQSLVHYAAQHITPFCLQEPPGDLFFKVYFSEIAINYSDYTTVWGLSASTD